MNQIPLALNTQVVYEPDKYFLHSGVKEVWDNLKALLDQKKYRSSFIYGQQRSGKTHLALSLAAYCESLSYKTEYIAGEEFGERANFGLSRSSFKANVFLIDDIDLYLQTVEPGGSGLFVNFIESQRKKGAFVIFFSGTRIENLPCDQHITSRLNEGRGFEIAQPDEAELPLLLDYLARQRGFKLKEQHKAYVMRRLERSVSAFEYLLTRLEEILKSDDSKVGYGLLKQAVE
jgi:chromosomal replication initiation ATPase DnaA